MTTDLLYVKVWFKQIRNYAQTQKRTSPLASLYIIFPLDKSGFDNGLVGPIQTCNCSGDIICCVFTLQISLIYQTIWLSFGIWLDIEASAVVGLAAAQLRYIAITITLWQMWRDQTWSLWSIHQVLRLSSATVRANMKNKTSCPSENWKVHNENGSFKLEWTGKFMFVSPGCCGC